jgi:hypothetical protein
VRSEGVEDEGERIGEVGSEISVVVVVLEAEERISEMVMSSLTSRIRASRLYLFRNKHPCRSDESVHVEPGGESLPKAVLYASP